MSLDGVCGDIPDFEEIRICVESTTPLPPGYSQAAWVNNNPGAWTVVPIPPALYLFGSGLLGLVGVARRKRA